MLLDSFDPADVILFLFLRTSLLPSRKRLLGNLVFFTTPLAGGAVCPTGGLTVWTAAWLGYSSFLGQSFMSGVSGDPRS